MKIKKCPNCGEEMNYNYRYECYQCNECGGTYNALLQELRPLEHWKDEFDEAEDY
jgi:uncharacterized protein YbbK (DUF523 family)